MSVAVSKSPAGLGIRRAEEPGHRFTEKFSDSKPVSISSLYSGKIAEVTLDINYPQHTVWIAFGAYSFPIGTVNPRWNCQGALCFLHRGQVALEFPLQACHLDNGQFTSAPPGYIPWAHNPAGSVAPALRRLGIETAGDDGYLEVPAHQFTIKADRAIMSLTSGVQSYANASWLFGLRVLSRN
jgi:hypothetical protein